MVLVSSTPPALRRTHFAVEALLVDDTVIFGRLARSTQTCTVVLHDRTVELGNDELVR